MSGHDFSRAVNDEEYDGLQPLRYGFPSVAKRKRAGNLPALFTQVGKGYSAVLGLIWATVQTGSPTLKRAKRRTLRFSPNLPIFCAIKSLMANDWSLMKGCSSRQTS